MRVLFDIVHPADVLFFKRPIEILQARGVEALFLSRKKDITCELLDQFGLDHEPITTAGNGIFGLGAELIRRDILTILAARRFKPDVMIGFGGLTGVVFVTRKDFSFMRGMLMWGGVLALVAIIGGVLFGFELGTWFSVAMIGFAGAAILLWFFS